MFGLVMYIRVCLLVTIAAKFPIDDQTKNRDGFEQSSIEKCLEISDLKRKTTIKLNPYMDLSLSLSPYIKKHVI